MKLELEKKPGEDQEGEEDKLTVDIGRKFFHMCVNRDENQNDGVFNAVQFREKFLEKLEDPAWMKNTEEVYTLDFGNVTEMSSGFANEAFAYFLTKRITQRQLMTKIKFVNIKPDMKKMISRELTNGYQPSFRESA